MGALSGAASGAGTGALFGPWGSAIGGAVGLIGGLLGGRKEDQALDWNRDAYVNLLNRLDSSYNYGRDVWQNVGLPTAMASILNSSGTANSILTDPGQLGGDLGFLLRDMITNQSSTFSPTNIMSQWGRPYENTRMGQYTGDMYNLANPDGSGLSNTRNLAEQVFAGGGWTPARQSFLDNIGSLLSGQNSQMGPQSDVGNEILGNRGNTQFSGGNMDMANQTLRQGGQTDWLNGLIQNLGGIAQSGGATQYTRGGQDFAGSLLSSDGRTPFSGAGAAAGLQGVLGGGGSAVNNTLADRGLELFDREPLMSPQQAASFAFDTAGTQARNAFRGNMQRAQARGGGPGSVVAAGQANEGMGEFADQISQAQSGAMREALLKQQELGLQQQGLGATALGSAGGQQNQRLGTYADLLSAMEGRSTDRLNLGMSGLGTLGGLENQRLLGALGMVPDAQNSANQRAQIYGSLGNQSDSNNIQRLGLGSNMLNSFTQNQLAALNALNSQIGTQDQYTLGAGNLFNTLNNSQSNILNQLWQNEMGAFQGGLNQAQLFGNLGNNMIGNAQNNLNMWNSNVMNSWNPLVALSGQGQQWGLQGLAGMTLGQAPNYAPRAGGGVAGAVTGVGDFIKDNSEKGD